MNDISIVCKSVESTTALVPSGLHYVETINHKNLAVKTAAPNSFQLIQGSKTWTFIVYAAYSSTHLTLPL